MESSRSAGFCRSLRRPIISTLPCPRSRARRVAAPGVMLSLGKTFDEFGRKIGASTAHARSGTAERVNDCSPGCEEPDGPTIAGHTGSLCVRDAAGRSSQKSSCISRCSAAGAPVICSRSRRTISGANVWRVGGGRDCHCGACATPEALGLENRSSCTVIGLRAIKNSRIRVVRAQCCARNLRSRSHLQELKQSVQRADIHLR